MPGCETVVFVAQAFPEASDCEVVEKADVFEHLYARYRADDARRACEAMIRLASAGCKKIARRPCSKSRDD
jgi:hypothetical protein